jgi:hypothetical protein
MAVEWLRLARGGRCLVEKLAKPWLSEWNRLSWRRRMSPMTREESDRFNAGAIFTGEF